MRGAILYLYVNRVTHAFMQSEVTDGIGATGRGGRYLPIFP